MKSSRILIKLGGASLQDPTTLSVLAETVRQYRTYGYQVILVHGGGPAINEELKARNITWEFFEGQRVTSPEMIEVIDTVLSGLVNKKIVRAIEAAGVPALGISGVENKMLLCRQTSEKLGLVGTIEKVNSVWVEQLLKLEREPVVVISPLGVGEDGQVYNINADFAASFLASSLKVDYLIYLTDQRGILGKDGSLLKTLSVPQIEGLLDDGTVSGGMLTKVRAVESALQHSVEFVRIMNAKDALRGLWSDCVGTWCYLGEGNEVLEYYEVESAIN